MDRSAISAALADSQRGWRRNVEARSPDDVRCGGTACALCEAFVDMACQGCPVSAKTGKRGCEGTPYFEAVHARDRWRERPGDLVAEEGFRAAATLEAEFLESLEVMA